MFAQGLTRKSIYALLGIAALVLVSVYYFEQPRACNIATEGKVAVRVSGLSWDADSWGFAYYQGLSAEEGRKKAGRLNSRIYVDGQSDKFAITKTDPKFEIEFETDQPTFRLIAEGDRFPQTISQHYSVPKKGCDIDIGMLFAPRGEGPEHTWPLPIVAAKMGYTSWQDLMADNNAVIRVLALGSGEEGVPDFTNDSLLELANPKIAVYPFNMDKKITFLQMKDVRVGAFIVVIPFSADEAADQDVSLKIIDTIKEAEWNPPRPWKFDPVTVSIRKGFATDIRVSPSADQ